MLKTISLIFIAFLSWALFLKSCMPVEPKTEKPLETPEMSMSETEKMLPKDDQPDPTPVPSALEQSMIEAGLTNISDLDSAIIVKLQYATANNFMEEDLYEGLTRCYLHPIVAEKLVKAQRILSEMKPGFSLVILDGARPKSVQQKMWDKVKGTEMERYVAVPEPGSLHNYGAAVDVTIADEFGNEIDMGTAYDHFGNEAQPRHHQQMLEEGKITQTHIDNRFLLKTVMKKAGFYPILSEWWHFNAISKAYARKEFILIE